MVNRVWNILTSLRLTVICLAAGLILVFVGTIAQVEQGLYNAQARYFKSFFVYWGPEGSSLKFPVMPGGYLIGVVMLANLVAAHAKRFELSRKKFGLFLVHGGLILLLLGQLFTDVLSRESAMRLTEGETKSYSEDFHENELAIVDTSGSDDDKVVSIAERYLARHRSIDHPELPFTVKVTDYWVNAAVTEKEAPAAVRSGATEGIGARAFVIPLPAVTAMDQRNTPAAVIELTGRDGKGLGRWLVSSRLNDQHLDVGSRHYDVALRFTRYYKPFSLTLVDFAHDKYKGTEIPKNFSSQVRLRNPATGEDREAKIFMNNPLRTGGLTFYQSGFDENDPRVTILQVVKNPSWLTPYLACVLVGGGLMVQFVSHLLGFLAKRRNAS